METQKLKVERGIIYQDLEHRLLNYFCRKEVDDIISETTGEKHYWTDNYIVILHELSINKFIIIADVKYDKLFSE